MLVTVNQSLILVGFSCFITWVNHSLDNQKLDFAPLLQAHACYCR